MYVSRYVVFLNKEGSDESYVSTCFTNSTERKAYIVLCEFESMLRFVS